MNLVVLLALTFAAYIFGSFPSGVVLGKTLKGVDIRNYGSGKTGATNSLRTLGWQISLLVFILDLAKGAIAVLLPLLLLDTDLKPWGVLAAGVACMLGHDYSIFIGFSGGRGVATGIGQVLVVSPLSALFAILVCLPILAITRYVSLVSVLGAVLIEIALIVNFFLHALPDGDGRFLIWGTVITSLVVIHHRDNIQRLLNGTERKLGEKAKPVTEQSVSAPSTPSSKVLNKSIPPAKSKSHSQK